MVSVMVTITVQRDIVAETEEEYANRLNEIVSKLESLGFNVNVESEDDNE